LVGPGNLSTWLDHGHVLPPAAHAFSSNPLVVFAGPSTLAESGGISYAGFLLAVVVVASGFIFVRRSITRIVVMVTPGERIALGWVVAALLVSAAAASVLILLLPLAMRVLDGLLSALPLVSSLARPAIGLTFEHYREVWIVDAFHQQFLNTMLITCGVVTISLSVGTLAGYAFARTPTRFAFWLLIIALVFRDLPHSVLVAGYLPAFISSREILQPLWDSAVLGPFLKLFAAQAPTLYGQPWAVIFVMVAINQPFTIWLLR
jgi:multiple sugar transport system permease protein